MDTFWLLIAIPLASAAILLLLGRRADRWGHWLGVLSVGAMILAHIERDGPKPTQKATARERIRSGRPQPLPGPGVLSSGNAIGTPALLPDGSASEDSVMSSTSGWRELPEQRSLPSSEGTR